jgi:hypothetical protein
LAAAQEATVGRALSSQVAQEDLAAVEVALAITALVVVLVVLVRLAKDLMEAVVEIEEALAVGLELQAL